MSASLRGPPLPCELPPLILAARLPSDSWAWQAVVAGRVTVGLQKATGGVRTTRIVVTQVSEPALFETCFGGMALLIIATCN